MVLAYGRVRLVMESALQLGEQPASNDELRAMLKPFPAERMEWFRIGTKIGSPKHDEPGVVEPIA